MKQKIVVARAVLHDPPVLFFDEATSGLDVMARRAVLDFSRRYPGEERAVVWSTHVMSEVEELCDRVAVLYRGRVVADDTVAGLKEAADAPDLEQAFFTLVRRSGLAEGQEVAHEVVVRPAHRGQGDPLDAARHRAIVSNLVIPLVLLPVIMLGLPLLLGGLFQREATTVTELAVQGGSTCRPSWPRRSRRRPPCSSRWTTPRRRCAPTLPRRPDRRRRVRGQGRRRRPRRGRRRRQGGQPARRAQRRQAAQRRRRVPPRCGRRAPGGRRHRPRRARAGGGRRTRDASTEAERSSGQLAWLIPFFIAIWTLTGGQMTAIDATAGEKERGTLEVLLVTPVRRGEVVFGKFLAVVTFGLSAAMMAIVGFVLGGTVLRRLFLPLIGEEGGEMAAMMGGT
jgi:hypothetical protein